MLSAKHLDFIKLTVSFLTCLMSLCCNNSKFKLTGNNGTTRTVITLTEKVMGRFRLGWFWSW